MITKDEITTQLNKFSFAKGKIVTVHTSLKKVGEISGGGDTLLDALIEFFTQDGGLLCIPTHTWDKDVCDLRKHESCIGVLPMLATKRPDAIRTLHPTHSMAVFGNKTKTEEFVKDEIFADTPTNPKGCYGKIYENNGYILLIGVGQDKNTYIHCVEEMLKTPDRLTDYKVEKTIIHKDGKEEKRHLYWFDEKLSDVSEKFPKFEKPFRYYGCITDGVLGNAKVQLCSAVKIKEVIELIYKNNNYGELLDDDNPIQEKLYIKETSK